MNPLSDFIEYCKSIKSPMVLELGTKRSIPNRCTMHKEFVPHASIFHGTDISYGEDVDFISDIHIIGKVVPNNSYDVVISCSTFEHFKYPHLAAYNISKLLKLNGCVFVQTHFSFPVHSYPHDYFRFSTEALAGCFGAMNGVEVMSTGYDFPCSIVSNDCGTQGSWLNTTMFGIKKCETPYSYIYELDTNLNLGER